MNHWHSRFISYSLFPLPPNDDDNDDVEIEGKKSNPENSQNFFRKLIGFFGRSFRESEDGGRMRKAYYHVNFFTRISFLLFLFFFFPPLHRLFLIYVQLPSLVRSSPLFPASHFPSLFSVLMPNFVFVCFCFVSFCFKS